MSAQAAERGAGGGAGSERGKTAQLFDREKQDSCWAKLREGNYPPQVLDGERRISGPMTRIVVIGLLCLLPYTAEAQNLDATAELAVRMGFIDALCVGPGKPGTFGRLPQGKILDWGNDILADWVPKVGSYAVERAKEREVERLAKRVHEEGKEAWCARMETQVGQNLKDMAEGRR
jgi:hypothetical protein